VTTQLRAGRLDIGTTPGNLAARAPMFVSVTVPALDGLVLSGAGNIAVTGLDSRTLGVALPGAGNIHVTGSTTRLDVRLGGAGTLNLHGLVARDARATLAGNGTILLTATRRLAATVSGTGTVVYAGGPRSVRQRVTGSGTITPG
jgi:hypothetical protein